MKKFSVILTVLLMITVLAACVPTDRTNISIDPVMEDDTAKSAELDFEQLHNDAVELFDGARQYSFITDVDISGSNSSKVISINAKCLEGVNEEEAGHFIAACVRHISEAAAVQYRRFEGTDETTFGPLWDTYSLEASVVPETDGAAPVFTLNVPAGSGIPLSPDIEKYEAEWEKALEIYLRNEK